MIEKPVGTSIKQITCDGSNSDNNIIGIGADDKLYWWDIDTAKWYLLARIKPVKK